MKRLLLLSILITSISSFSQMTTSGVAIPLGPGCDCYRLVPAAAGQAGAIWSPNTIDLNNDFDFTFNMTFGNGDVWAGDGSGFILQQNPSGIGSSGNGLGYAAPYGAPPISASNFIIEIDQFDNGGAIPTDHTNDHVGMSANGSQHHTEVAATPFTGLQEIGDGAYHEVRVTWDAGLQIIAFYWEGNAFPLIAHNIDLINTVFGGNPNVYWGWTAGTGGVYGEYNICLNPGSGNFTQDITSVCPGLPVTFTDASVSDLNYYDSYTWDFGDGSPTGSGSNPSHSYNAPGNYTVTMDATDAFGCTYTSTSSVTVLDSITMNMSAVDVTCFGDTDGQVTSNPTNGTGPYSYLWDDPGPQTTQTATNLAPGWYTVEVIDDLGCVGYDSIEVMEPLEMTLTMDSTNVNCPGNMDGTATGTPVNGVSPFNYLWDDPGTQTTQTATGLDVGWYILVVTDDDGCTATDSIEVGEDPAITLIMDSTDASCNGGMDGTATATPVNGTAPYGYSWNDPGTQSTQTATGLGAGVYTVLVTDVNGCTAEDSVEVVEALGMTVELDSIPVTCFGGSDGAAIATVITGTGPFTYIWDDPGAQSTDTASALNAGTYIVTVTDAAGCVVTDTIDVTQPPAMTATVTANDALCNGEASGDATVAVTNGTSPYTYLWDDSSAQTTVTATGLSAGAYNVVVTDVDGCTANASTTIGEPTALTGGTSSEDDFGSGGAIDLTVSGGTTPYTYLWSNGATTEDLSGASEGTYDVIVTDANGCTVTFTDTIELILELDFPTAISPNADGMNDVYEIIGLERFPENSFTITNRWGNVVFKVDNYSNDWGGNNMDGEPLPEGVYFMVFESGIEQHTKYVEIKR